MSDKLATLKALLAEQGYDISDAAKALRSLNKEAADAKAAAFEAKKEGNKDALISAMVDIRAQVADIFADLLPGTHATWTARVTKEGEIVVTANDCHASGFRDSLHCTPSGDIVTGEEGAEMARNVRPRAKRGE